MQLELEVTSRSLFVRVGRTAQVMLEVGEWAGWVPSGYSGRGGRVVSWLWFQGAASR